MDAIVKEIWSRNEYQIIEEEFDGPFMVPNQYRIIDRAGNFLAVCPTKEAAENLLSRHINDLRNGFVTSR